MDYSALVEILQSHKATRITEKEIRAVAAINDYSKYCRTVEKLVTEGLISPVVSSGSNGMNPPLYKRYLINKQQKSINSYASEIRLLSGAFNIEGYLENQQKYEDHRPLIQIVDAFIKSDSQALSVQLSINERSFQIFGKEKALKEDKNIKAVLNFSPELINILNFYMTPEPFFIHRITQMHENINVLIIENKDTWYTLKSIMKPDMNSICGICFDILLYGEGKKVSRRVDSLTEFDTSFFKDSSTTYYYFGDLDFEGIGIFNELRDINPKLNIVLFSKLYSWMIKEATALSLNRERRFELPQTKEKQNRKCIELFLEEFNNDERILISEILEKGKYIPQEILNRKIFFDKLINAKMVQS